MNYWGAVLVEKLSEHINDWVRENETKFRCMNTKKKVPLLSEVREGEKYK